MLLSLVIAVEVVACLLGHAVEALDVRRFGELLLEREVGVEHRQVAVGLLFGDRVAGQAVARIDDQVHDLFAALALGVLFQRVLERHDRRFVFARLIIGVGVQVSFLVEPFGQLGVDLAEVLDAVALRIARHEFVDGDQRVPGHRLVARGTRREVVEAERVHALGVFDEGAAAEFAAEVVQQGRSRVEIAVLVLAAGVEERDAVFARRARVVVLHAFEKGRGALPFLLLVVLQRLAVNQFGLPAFQKGVHPGASSEDDRCRHSAKGV